MSPIFRRLTLCVSMLAVKASFEPERRTCSRTLTTLCLLLLGCGLVAHRSFFFCFTRSYFPLISESHLLGQLFLPILEEVF
jgi:hypothetical protein